MLILLLIGSETKQKTSVRVFKTNHEGLTKHIFCPFIYLTIRTLIMLGSDTN